MSPPVISVENLGKMYHIGLAQKRAENLREALQRAALAPFDYLRTHLRHLASSRARIRSEVRGPRSEVQGLRSKVQGPMPNVQGLTPEDAPDILWALRNVSFEVQQGEVLGIIGRNGAGKSTLLKILSRIMDPTEGHATIRGRVNSLLEIGTGFHPELTGRENIYLNAALHGMKRREITARLDAIIDFAEIERFIDTPVKRYSSGMYTRLAFAVAAHLEPDILIVDEVLAVGDVGFQKKCLGKMQDVAKGGRTVLFVSHNMGAVHRLCQRGMLLENGTVKQIGEIRDVVAEYLAAGAQQSTVYTQARNATKAMNLRRVVMESEPGTPLPGAEVTYEQPLTIAIDYEVNELVRDCTVWLALETSEGVMVFTTADFDANTRMLERREPGYYRARLLIPPKWLNYGRYTVIVGVVQNAPLIVFDRTEVLIFTVREIGSPSAMHQAGTRRGVLQPLMEWTTEKTASASV